jgi:hypothetical protein
MVQDYFERRHGIITVDGEELDIPTVFNAKFKWSTQERDVIGYNSMRTIPVALGCNGTIERDMTDLKLLTKLLSSTAARTGTAEALHAGLSLAADDLLEPTDAEIATASRISFECITAPITTAGSLVVYGTDAQGGKIAELVEVGLLTVGQKVTTKQYFKTAPEVAIIGIRSTGNGLLKMDSVAAGATITPGRPKKFTISAEVEDEDTGNSLTLTINNCFFTDGAFDIETPMSDKMAFAVELPSRDIILQEIIA